MWGLAARALPMIARAAAPAAKVAGNGRLAAFTVGRMMASNNEPSQPTQPAKTFQPVTTNRVY